MVFSESHVMCKRCLAFLWRILNLKIMWNALKAPSSKSHLTFWMHDVIWVEMSIPGVFFLKWMALCLQLYIYNLKVNYVERTVFCYNLNFVAFVTLVTLGKPSYWVLVPWGRNADIFNKQQFSCCFADYSLSTFAYWTKW